MKVVKSTKNISKSVFNGVEESVVDTKDFIGDGDIISNFWESLGADQYVDELFEITKTAGVYAGTVFDEAKYYLKPIVEVTGISDFLGSEIVQNQLVPVATKVVEFGIEHLPFLSDLVACAIPYSGIGVTIRVGKLGYLIYSSVATGVIASSGIPILLLSYRIVTDLFPELNLLGHAIEYFGNTESIEVVKEGVKQTVEWIPSGQMMKSGQMMNSEQLMKSGQMMKNALGQWVPSGQMMKSGQKMLSDQLKHSGQLKKILIDPFLEII